MTTGEDKQPESNFDALAEAKKMFALYEAGAQDAGVSVEQYGGKFNDYQFAKAIIALERELDEAKHLQETAEQRYEKFYEGYAPPSSVSSSLAKPDSGTLEQELRGVADAWQDGSEVRRVCLRAADFLARSVVTWRESDALQALANIKWDVENCQWECNRCDLDPVMRETDLYSAIQGFEIKHGPLPKAYSGAKTATSRAATAMPDSEGEIEGLRRQLSFITRDRDTYKRELAEAKDDVTRLHREKMDALFGPDGFPRSPTPSASACQDSDRDYIVTKLEQRVLAKHGGKADPWQHHMNLTEGDSAMHFEAATCIKELVRMAGSAPIAPTSARNEIPGTEMFVTEIPGGGGVVSIAKPATAMHGGPKTNALADRYGDIDPDSPYWAALDLATELEQDNFRLAAGLCLHGLRGDEHGNAYCPRIVALERELSEFRLNSGRAISALVASATPRAEKEDPGTVKILTALVERAYGIFTASGVLRVAEQDPDSNDPIVAWASDVRSILYRNKPAWTTNG